MRILKPLLLLLVAIPTWALAASESEGWTITTKSKQNYNGVTLANGRIGLVSGANLFEVNSIVLNGVYDKRGVGDVSRIVRGPLFTNLEIAIDGEAITNESITDWEQTLNMREAYLRTDIKTAKAAISYSIYALRNMPFMGMIMVEVTPTADATIEVTNATRFPSELYDRTTDFQVLRDGRIRMPVLTSTAKTRTGMHDVATCAAFLFEGERADVVGKQVDGGEAMTFTQSVKGGESLRFALAGANCSTRDFCIPKDEAERMAVFAIRSDIKTILDGHLKEWARLWESDIIIEGDIEAQLDVRLALYNLYSFAGENTRLSIPPMGLSTVSGYNGHVFWDTELWMYPPLLMLNQQMARSCVDYRTDRLARATQKARSFGYEGCMFPWESDDSGEEATPTWCLTGIFEQHITADVGIAFWNYYRVTKDKEWLRNEGFPLMKQVAAFWLSRVKKNDDGTYSINNVVGADEYAPNVDDNAFTNGSVKAILNYTALAAKAVGEKADPRWKEVADNIAFHYMEDGTMKEHKNYNGEKIKQADVNLLCYPLGIVTDSKRIEQDLVYYAKVIDKNGPAMGRSILSIIYAQMGNAEQAYTYFKNSYNPHKRPPFGVLSESANSNNPYFATGAGGMLQAVLSGFGGLRITEKGIVQKNPILPKEWKSLTITGVGVDKKSYTVTH